jgi:acyl-coenzyme A synthetase/AMP-(fatty) acid ligase
VEMANNSLKRIICSGEALSRPLQDRCLSRMSAGLYNLYGPTEAAVDVTYWECKKEDSKASVPIGKPIANTQIYILDEHLNPVPIGVAGELHIGGVQVAKGYVNRPELTAERFIPDPFSRDSAGRLYKTGDWSRFRPDGNIEFIGRMDGQVKIHGLRIELDEITVALVEEVDFIQQAVTIISHEGADARLVAYVVLEKSAKLDESAIREGLLQRLPAYMIPEVYIPLEEIPLSPNGKVDRKRLPAVQAMLQKSASGQKPSNETEREVLQIWQSVLQLADVGVERNFFDVGGTSILAVRLTNKLGEEYCQTLSPMFVFSYPNIKDQARYIDSQQRESSADIMAMQDRVEKARRAARSAGRRRR